MLTTADVFLEKTSLLVGVLVEAVLVEHAAAKADQSWPYPSDRLLTPAQVAWFIAHCDQRFRYYHANNPKWRKWLEDRNSRIDPRNQCKVWIRHWLAAYVKDSARYETEHRACPACGD